MVRNGTKLITYSNTRTWLMCMYSCPVDICVFIQSLLNSAFTCLWSSIQMTINTFITRSTLLILLYLSNSLSQILNNSVTHMHQTARYSCSVTMTTDIQCSFLSMFEKAKSANSLSFCLAFSLVSRGHTPFSCRMGCGHARLPFHVSAYFCMGAYKRNVVVVIKMGAYIHGVLISCGSLLSRFIGNPFSCNLGRNVVRLIQTVFS